MSPDTQSTYGGAFAIVPSDTADQFCAAIYVGGAGNVSVVPESGGAAVTFTAPPVGSILPLRCKRINSTLTTATLLIGLM